MTKEIELTQGKVATVDNADFDWLNQWRWFANFDGSNWYAVRVEGHFPFRKMVKMHRQIMEVTDPKIPVDHCDGDGLNNQRLNLRVCNNSRNQQNRRVNKRSTTGYKGVSYHKTRHAYQAAIKANGKRLYLGYFSDAVSAAHAYDAAAKKYFGEYASLNFPEAS